MGYSDGFTITWTQEDGSESILCVCQSKEAAEALIKLAARRDRIRIDPCGACGGIRKKRQAAKTMLGPAHVQEDLPSPSAGVDDLEARPAHA